MDKFFQVTAGILLVALFTVALSKREKDFAVLLSVAVCCIAVTAIISYMEPVISFIRQLQTTAGIDPEMIKTLMKASGVGILAEIAALICTDCGNSALGKTIQLLATAVILWLALPFMQSLLDMMQKILEET